MTHTSDKALLKGKVAGKVASSSKDTTATEPSVPQVQSQASTDQTGASTVGWLSPEEVEILRAQEIKETVCIREINEIILIACIMSF
jgi:hypothetical protein